MKTATDQQACQQQQPRVQKLERTQRFTKQFSQGSVNFITKATASQKTIVRLSENSLSQKSKTIVNKTSRAGSIPKCQAKEAREFGREIGTNNTAMMAISQQTQQVQILQGKLKPNVSRSKLDQTFAFPYNQQVFKKNIVTYRTQTAIEKPLTQFSSQTSLTNPFQTQQILAPGQKFQQQSSQLNPKNKYVVSPTLDEKNPNSSANLAKSAYLSQRTKTLLMTEQGKVDTPLIKLTLIEESKSPETILTNEKDVKDFIEVTEDELTVSQGTEEKMPKESVSEIFKQRLTAYRKQISKNMVFTDQLEIRDPQMVAELATDIYKNIRIEENFKKVDAEYLNKVQAPAEVKDTSRAFLIEWIIDVHRKFRLLPETLYVTVFIIDRFLSLKQIKKSQLHILGVTSLLISTKYEEIYPPELKDLLTVSENKFTRAEVLKMEKEILVTLQFDLTSPSAYRFLERFRKLSSLVGNDDKVFFFAQYIQEISLLDASLLKYNASEIAAASLILSSKSIKKVNVWNREMERATNYTDEYLQLIAEDVKSFVLEVNPKFLTTLKYKFSKQEFKEVASIPFKF